jgi:hypothetical protein
MSGVVVVTWLAHVWCASPSSPGLARLLLHVPDPGNAGDAAASLGYEMAWVGDLA